MYVVCLLQLSLTIFTANRIISSIGKTTSPWSQYRQWKHVTSSLKFIAYSSCFVSEELVDRNNFAYTQVPTIVVVVVVWGRILPGQTKFIQYILAQTSITPLLDCTGDGVICDSSGLILWTEGRVSPADIWALYILHDNREGPGWACPSVKLKQRCQCISVIRLVWGRRGSSWPRFSVFLKPELLSGDSLIRHRQFKVWLDARKRSLKLPQLAGLLVSSSVCVSFVGP